ncbi:hypothetical protein [Cupriavidus alkaliphilus]|uniref:Uncharacterized protein n=1 Tax=Cupriavidus alkaliphilus TaxID=942866 RepID=A0A7W4VGR1_9BURK|nr:hypothetical protein [Cupriavidus alkaliphilus]MBB3010660.1 hypothetical protein [Cupriavidus alkaliphilus]
MSEAIESKFYVTGLVQSRYGVGFRTPQKLNSEQEAQTEADRLNVLWLEMGEAFHREHGQLLRVKDGGFWVTPVDEFNDLAAGELLAGVPYPQRREPVNQFQQAILAEPFQKRFARIVALIEAPDPSTVIA